MSRNSKGQFTKGNVEYKKKHDFQAVTKKALSLRGASQRTFERHLKEIPDIMMALKRKAVNKTTGEIKDMQAVKLWSELMGRLAGWSFAGIDLKDTEIGNNNIQVNVSFGDKPKVEKHIELDAS